MKLVSLFSRVMVVLAFVGFFASCVPTEEVDPPIVSFISGDSLVSSNATVNSGAEFIVRLKATQGANPMNSLEILENDVKLSTDRFTLDGKKDNNPKLLFDADKKGFTYDLVITAQAAGESTYKFLIKDEGSKASGSKSLVISIDPASAAPTITIDGASEISLEDPTTLEMKVNVVKGGAALKSIEIQEDGVAITDLTRIAYGELTNKFSANPMDIPTADVDGFTKSIYLKTHSEVTSKTYSVIVTDADGGKATGTVKISITGSSTPLTATYTGVKLYNKSGPNNGSVDLNTGTNVPSSSADRDIADTGIDGNGNWNKTIVPVNGTDLRSLASGETTKYADVNDKETIVSLFNAGTSLSETGLLTVGSTYTALANGEYFIFTVTSVNETNTDNKDYFELDIKRAQ